MRASITDWTANIRTLRVRVSAEPLSMAKDYVWAYHTTNYYGQGSVWTWWHYKKDEDPSTAVYGDEAQELLTSLVRNHPVLGLISSYYKIPEINSGM